MVEQKLQVVKSLVSNKNKGPCTSVFDHRLVLGEENNKNIKMVCVQLVAHRPSEQDLHHRNSKCKCFS